MKDIIDLIIDTQKKRPELIDDFFTKDKSECENRLANYLYTTQTTYGIDPVAFSKLIATRMAYYILN